MLLQTAHHRAGHLHDGHLLDGHLMDDYLRADHQQNELQAWRQPVVPLAGSPTGWKQAEVWLVSDCAFGLAFESAPEHRCLTLQPH